MGFPKDIAISKLSSVTERFDTERREILRKLNAVRDDIRHSTRISMVEVIPCACGCGEPKRKNGIWATESCQPRVYRKLHRDEINERKRIYRALHPEEIKERARVYHELHRNEINERKRIHRALHAELSLLLSIQNLTDRHGT